MISNLKNNVILVIVFVVLLTISGYLLINYHFIKSVQLKTFSECLSVVGDAGNNWVTHNETINYCHTETKK